MRGPHVAERPEWTPRLDGMASTSGCWKHWENDHLLCLSFRVVMEDGSTKFYRIKLDSESKAVTMAEITDLRELPKDGK
jgi:hypothetical protein